MYLEHDSGRLRSLVERTAIGLAALPPSELGAALQVIEDIVYARAVSHRGVGFAVNFSALFLAAVRARLAAAPIAGAAAPDHAFEALAAFDQVPPLGGGERAPGLLVS